MVHTKRVLADVGIITQKIRQTKLQMMFASFLQFTFGQIFEQNLLLFHTGCSTKLMEMRSFIPLFLNFTMLGRRLLGF